jgi:hypothetical protein
MNDNQRNIAIFIHAIVVTLALMGATTRASAASPVMQTTIGNCNQSSITTYQVPTVVDDQPARVANPKFSTIGPSCVIMKIDRKINALENAQLQLLIAEHPTRLTTGPVSLGLKLGEKTTSIWVDVSNQSTYDVHGLHINLATAQSDVSKNGKAQTYLSSSLPGAIVATKNLVLKGGESVKLLAATPSDITKSIPDNWCLYDLGNFSTDLATDGYEKAKANELEKISRITGYIDDHASIHIVPMLFTVRYVDIFDVIHEIPVLTYLRTASPDSTSVFYPSLSTYGSLECHNR